MSGPGDPDWGRVNEDPAKRIRRLARQKRIDDDVKARQRIKPADPTDVVANAAHRARLRIDAGQGVRKKENDSPTAMARKMLEQRQEMAAWQDIFNDRRKR